MIRTLTLVAIVGFVLCIGCIASAVAIAGGPFAIRDWAVVHSDDSWGWGGHHRHHGKHDDFDLNGSASDNGGPQATRDFTWSGGELLRIDVPADIVYTQGPTAKLTIQGPQGALDRLVVKAGHIGMDNSYYDGDRLKIVMTAPGVRKFDLSGSQNLVVEGYKQDRLEVDISGSAHVSAKGAAKLVVLDIAGSGDADLTELATDEAQVDISGSGSTKIGPKKLAKVDVSGDGEVTLTVKPEKLVTDITGSGHVSQPGTPN